MPVYREGVGNGGVDEGLEERRFCPDIRLHDYCRFGGFARRVAQRYRVRGAECLMLDYIA